jgi:hypothetical protein
MLGLLADVAVLSGLPISNKVGERIDSIFGRFIGAA